LPKSTTVITDEQCQGKQDAWNEGRRELTTMQVSKLFSTGRSSNEIAATRQVGARNGKIAWWCTKEAATKSWRRDLQMPVSLLVLAVAAETSYDFSYSVICPAGHGSPSLRGTIVPKQSRRGMRLPRPFSGARNDSTDYPCPRSILHREDAGRSWAIRNTSNIPEVD
jgi:hypothetical protein